MRLPYKFSKSKGFTLIELLIVVAILGVLGTIVVVNFPGASRSARDARRREELGQYRIALEVYANKTGGLYYSQDGSAIRPHTLCGSGNPFGPISCPQDPRVTTTVCTGQACQYSYQSSGSGANYLLWARLEKPIDPTNRPCFIICSQGLSGEAACPSGASPACPL